MTRKDYKLIAEAFRLSKPESCETFEGIGRERALYGVTHVLEKDNPRFSSAKFREAVYRES